MHKKEEKESKEPKMYKTGDVDVLGISVADPDKPCEGQKRDQSSALIIKKVLFSNDTRFNSHETEYLLDVLGPLWEKSFVEEAAAAFVAFQELNEEPVEADQESKSDEKDKDKDESEEKKEERRRLKMEKRLQRFNKRFASKTQEEEEGEDKDKKDEDNKEDEEEKPELFPSITRAAVHAGLKKFKWVQQTDLSSDVLFEKYVNDNQTELEFKTMTVRDFLLMNIELAVKNIKMENCEHCFKKTLEKIDSFFNYADCDHSRLLNSTELISAVKNINQEETYRIPIKNSIVNDFVLKLMDPQSATISKKEFEYGILVALMERFFSLDGKPIVDKVQKMKKYRFKKVELGYGPKRRR